MARRVTDMRILDAVVATVLAHGYDGATTRQIAATAGINEATLFRRYGDKAAMVGAAIAAEVDAFAHAGPVYTGELEADLRRVVGFYAGIVADRGRLLVVLLAELPRRPELATVIREPLRVVIRVRGMLRRYHRDGLLAAQDPTAAMTDLIGPLILHAVVTHAAPRLISAPFDLDAHVREFLDGHRRHR